MIGLMLEWLVNDLSAMECAFGKQAWGQNGQKTHPVMKHFCRGCAKGIAQAR